YQSTNWDLFKEAVDRCPLPEEPIITAAELERRYDNLICIIQEAGIEASRPRGTGVGRRDKENGVVQWWDDELREKRAALKRACRRGEKALGKRLRSEYKSLIENAPNRGVRGFCGQLELGSGQGVVWQAQTVIMWELQGWGDTAARRDAEDRVLNASRGQSRTSFTVEEVQQALEGKRASNDKSPGMDGVRWRHLLELPRSALEENDPKNKRWCVVATDYADAFGRLDHSKIHEELEKQGVTDDIRMGCPQGSVLSPALFVLVTEALASEILLDRACLIHYHKRSIMDSIKATARTHRRKWATFLSEDRALGDGHEGELAWAEPCVQSAIAGSIRIPPSKDISIVEETNTVADYKIYTDGSLAAPFDPGPESLWNN
ncbi:hypothetical protein FOZ63_017898, partial [Perkinsus olseni]